MASQNAPNLFSDDCFRSTSLEPYLGSSAEPLSDIPLGSHPLDADPFNDNSLSNNIVGNEPSSDNSFHYSPLQATRRQVNHDSAPPNSFERTGLHNQHVIWPSEAHEDFIVWWWTTTWYQKNYPEGSSRLYFKWKPSNRTSPYWDGYYQVARASDGHPFIVCKNCLEQLGHPLVKSSGTKALSNHLSSNKCKRSIRRNPSGVQQRITNSIRRVQEQDHIERELNQGTFMEYLLQVIASLQLPFRAAENEHWRRLCHLLNPAFKLPSHKTLRDHLLKRVIKVEDILKQQLSTIPQVSLSLDCWSNTQRQSFLAMNAYWIDENFKFHGALIGFENLEANHTGFELSKTLISVLQKYDIHSKVQTITTDNASNNSTLIQEANQAIDQLALRHKALFPNQITRIPCLSHVIQLALQSLLGCIRIDPKNEDLQRNWDDTDMKLQEYEDIPKTLSKIRKIAVYINSSSQRRNIFNQFQDSHKAPEKQRLVLLQDVKTRWNSTCVMLIRARELKESITDFLEQYPKAQSLKLGLKEWKQIEYLIDLTKPFAFFTHKIGASSGPTVHHVYNIYETLFTHLESSRDRLERKPPQPWTNVLIRGINKSHKTLRHWFTQTYTDLGTFYALGTILAPSYKTDPFEQVTFGETTTDWVHEYVQQLRSIYNEKYLKYASEPKFHAAGQQLMDDLTLTLTRFNGRKRNRQSQIISEGNGGANDEISRYLAEPRSLTIPPLEFWKMREADFPGLARMARDILCTPAAGVGTERVFNGARDICYFRRARLLPVTIRALAMLNHFDGPPSTSEQEAALEDSTQLAELSTEQLKLEEEERLEELKRAWTRDYISDADDEDNNDVQGHVRKIIRRECPKGMQQTHASDHILPPDAEYEEINRVLRQQDPDLYDPPMTPKQKHAQAKHLIPRAQHHRQQGTASQVQQRQSMVDQEPQSLQLPPLNSRSGRQIKLTGKALLNKVWLNQTNWTRPAENREKRDDEEENSEHDYYEEEEDEEE